MKIKKWLLIMLLLMILPVYAKTVKVSMYQTAATGHGRLIGTIEMKDTDLGLLIVPNLKGLTPGLHGFHIHMNPSCGNHGDDAGGHLDPEKTDKHLGPYNEHGHLGDLPALFVNTQGVAQTPVIAPRLTINQLYGHTLMVHEGGDNYSDQPEKLGGGGARIACGVIHK